MDTPNLLIIGPNRYVGGIQQYIDKQSEYLKQKFNVRIYDVEAPMIKGFFQRPLVLLATGLDMLRFPFRQRPQLVHIHTAHSRSFYRSTFYVLFSAYIWDIPVILHIHGSSFDEFASSDSRLDRFVQNWVYTASDEVIVLSEYWKDILRPYMDEEKITILPNAVDPNKYSPIYDVHPPRIVFISHLIDRKGVNEFVEVIEELLQDNELEVKVDIAGKGPLSNMVKQLAEKHSVVSYHGYVTEEQKRELLSQGSIYVLPSYAEGLPIAILEAMAGGTAILSTRVGSIPEVINDESGRLVSPKDTDSLLTELRSLVESPAEVRLMGHYNRNLVKEQYSWSNIINNLIDRYEFHINEGEV